MYFVTKEIVKNKTLKKVLKENTKFKNISISKKDKYWDYDIDFSLLWNAYEMLFQLHQIKKENRLSEFHGLKYSRGKEILIRSRYEYLSQKLLKKIHKYEKIIMNYLYGNKEKKLEEAIIYLTRVAEIRDDTKIKEIDIFKEDIKQLKIMNKNFDKKILKKIKNSNFNYVIEAGYLTGEIDILNNQTIIDIKTTIYPKITREMINQLIIYAILLEINTGIEIKEVGIYFEKYKKLKTIKVKKLFKNKKNIIEYLEKRYRC